jgi:DNA repair protein RecO (recombination protein O)
MSSTHRVDIEASFLVHARPYRETSQILEVLTQHHGRIGLVARGARRPKSKLRSILQPFQPLRVSWSGRGSLYTLHAAEPAAPIARLRGTPLMAGFYLNELILVFMRRGDPHPDLFAHYTAALADLGRGEPSEPVLRRFELSLLAEVGYGLIVDQDVANGTPLLANRRYEYVVDRGPVPVADDHAGALVFSGAQLLAIGNGKFDSSEQIKCAKRLMRAVLDHHLDGRPLKTRRVFSAMT